MSVGHYLAFERKGVFNMADEKKVEIFLSYCWEDEKVANDIYDRLVINSQINLHRDIIDIKKWNSIREYMNSISKMDYTILLISESYLKSKNCMYEVLEVMRDREYENKIFPAVIYPGIYKPAIRAKFVHYWQDAHRELQKEIVGIEPQNMGPLSNDSKQYQDIASNIAEFLDVVADMNNPQARDVALAVEEKLNEQGFLPDVKPVNIDQPVTKGDLFSQLGIQNHVAKNTVTDLDISRFITKSYRDVIQLFTNLCNQFERENDSYTVITENVDTRNSIFQFYENGKILTSIKICLNDSFGQLSIALSVGTYSFASGNSWNNFYSPVNQDGELKLKPMMSMFRSAGEMDTNGVVKDIWEGYVLPYLHRK